MYLNSGAFVALSVVVSVIACVWAYLTEVRKGRSNRFAILAGAVVGMAVQLAMLFLVRPLWVSP